MRRMGSAAPKASVKTNARDTRNVRSEDGDSVSVMVSDKRGFPLQSGVQSRLYLQPNRSEHDETTPARCYDVKINRLDPCLDFPCRS